MIVYKLTEALSKHTVIKIQILRWKGIFKVASDRWISKKKISSDRIDRMKLCSDSAIEPLPDRMQVIMCGQVFMLKSKSEYMKIVY